MRLLDTASYTLSYFQGQIPDYAILSHVWEEEEVTFGDIADLNKAVKMKGFAKIVGACKTALKHRLKYIWIDTCCINKESSAELSEAINSMFVWYKNAQICYAYLSDVLSDEDPSERHSSFAMSKWFTRGWTLQELLAPSSVVFHGADWVDIGTKGTLHKAISIVTGIGEDHVVGRGFNERRLKLEDVPAAVKMSWAAHRLTTREEDMAYSLMGLFGVNMPLLYGEGGQAFIRLQHEIIKASDDHSIFAFVGNTMLARSPSEFLQSAGVKLQWKRGEISKPYSITNKGLYIQLPLCEIVNKSGGHSVTIAFLNCYLDDHAKPLVIKLDSSSSSSPPSLSEGWYWRSPEPFSHPTNKNKLQFGIPSGWIAKAPAQLYSIYIIDGDPYKSTSAASHRNPQAGALTVLVTLTAPVEYGPLSASNTRQGWLRETVQREKLDENKWKVVWVPQEDEWRLDLDFSNSTQKYAFTVVAVGDHGGKTKTFSCLLQSEHAWGRNQKRLLDRSSITLTSGWTVGATCRASSQSSAEISIKIKHTDCWHDTPPRSTVVLMPKPPTNNCVTLFVTPPAPHHGYTLAETKLVPDKGWGTPRKCAPYRDSFLVFVNRDLDESRVAVGPFKSSAGKPFFLFLLASGSSDRSVIWDPKTTVSQAGWDGEGGHPIGDSYSVSLNEGNKVYVSTWKNRDTSMPNYVIKLSM